MARLKFFFLFLISIGIIFHGSAQKKPDKDDIERIIYLVGNTGVKKRQERYPVIDAITEQLEKKDKKSSVLFLGNVFPRNFFPQGASDIEKYLKGENYYKLLEEIKDSKADIYVNPGPIEWFFGSSNDKVTIRRIEKLMQKFFDDKVFLPNKGCPGPEEVDIGDNTILIFIDTQWWMNREKEGVNWKNPNCEVQNGGDLLVLLNDAVVRNKGNHIIVVGYHPIMSFGKHAGYFPTYIHFTPPVLGSLYYLYRNWIGQIDDFSNPSYFAMIRGLKSIFEKNENIVYVSSHEKSLQYIREGNFHQIISGTGIDGSYVKVADGSFTSDQEGFMKLILYDNEEMWLESWGIEADGNEKLLFEAPLYKKDKGQFDEYEQENIDYSGMTIDTMASRAYGYPKKSPGLMGNNYRAEWIQALREVPYMDIGKTKGGLEPVKRGGGMQTRSLRLENGDDQEYVLRSIEKFPEAAVPEELRNTIAADLVKDLISSSHPYAAVAIPTLADAVGVYHTNPKVVYLPDDPRLGIYREEYGNGLYLFEERPMDEFGTEESFGKPRDIIGTDEVIDEITDDNELYIDQEQVLKSRLFDIWIGDWDRHDDQWRWAEFKAKGKNRVFRPIPRDRDQAFFYNDGLIIKYGTGQPSFAKFQGFHEKIRDVKGMNYNARHFDRTFLTEPDWDDWNKTTDYLQKNLTDSVIEKAIHKFPPEIFFHSGEEIIRKLKIRRNDLDIYAREFYEFLSEEVNVVGSDEEEWFDVKRVNDNETRVTVWDLKQKSEKPDRKMYDRVFTTDVTDEIRLFGLGDEDRFTISGRVKKGIKVRVIGGSGDDELEDYSRVRGLSKKTVVYDNVGGITVEGGNEIKDEISNDQRVNNYDRYDFQYDYAVPLAYIDISPDDGVFLAAEVKMFKYGFRKDPYKNFQKFSLRYSPRVNSFKFKYEGDFIELIGGWDLNIITDLKFPTYTDYYYGLGNESLLIENLREADFYHFQYASIDIQPVLRKPFRQRSQFFEFGPIMQFYRLNDNDETERKFLQDFPEADLEEFKFYTGIRAGYTFDSRDDKHIPHHGVFWSSWASRTYEVNNDSIRFSRLSTDLSFYQTTHGSLSTTYAFRMGGIVNDGDYQFYQSNDLGGKTNLRGHRRMRFSGDHLAYVNLELRMRLLRFNMPLFPGSFGWYGFLDSGRVWYKNNAEIDPTAQDGKSTLWHVGYGGGLWIAPFRKVVFTADLSRSTTDEQLLVNLRYGFFF